MLFYLDFEGNLGRAATVDLLCALSEDMPVFTFLGNYRGCPPAGHDGACEAPLAGFLGFPQK